MILEDVKVGKNCNIARMQTDNGSNKCLVTHTFAKKENLRSTPVTYLLQTVNQDWIEKHDLLYEIPVLKENGDKVNIIAYGIEKISDSSESVDLSKVRDLFPSVPSYVFNPIEQKPVDIILGLNYLSLHPKYISEQYQAGNL